MKIKLKFNTFARAVAVLSFCASLCSLASAAFFAILVVLLSVFCIDGGGDCDADTAPGAFFILIAGFLCSFALFAVLGTLVLQNERLHSAIDGLKSNRD